MKEFQLRTSNHKKMIEWIPFDRLDNIELIGKEGFGFVFHAIWLAAIRKIDSDQGNYLKARQPYSTVLLKTYPVLSAVKWSKPL